MSIEKSLELKLEIVLHIESYCLAKVMVFNYYFHWKPQWLDISKLKNVEIKFNKKAA
jgi:hypothetical protein